MTNAPINVVKFFIASKLLDPLPTRTVGNITLQEHQVDAEIRVAAALKDFSGALLADDVGLGKTWVALAIAQRYRNVHVLAPASLLPMWRNATSNAAAHNVHLHSLHRVSASPHSLTADNSSVPSLVVIDEAHLLRNHATLRHKRVAEFVVGHHVLLLSATPVHNNANDLRSLLSLFMGSKASSTDVTALEKVVIRRGHDSVNADHIPTLVHHAPLLLPADEATLDAIMALPDPLPARGGSSAGALIKLGLLRAWCSSDAALAQSIRTRRLRGEALAHALQSNRYPTNAEMKAWIVADDSLQLTFSELISSEATHPHQLLERLWRHLRALATLQRHHSLHANHDAARATFLRTLVANESTRPVVAFTRYTATVKALYRALSDIAGVAALSAKNGLIASGPMPRQEILHRFAPVAHSKPPPHERERIRLLISTDIIAEGVNLQDAGTVVHLDLPWTEALRQQREGRCARIGSPFSSVNVFTITPPAAIDRIIHLSQLLQRKAGIAARTFSVTESVSSLHNLLSQWLSDGGNMSPLERESLSRLLPSTPRTPSEPNCSQRPSQFRAGRANNPHSNSPHSATTNTSYPIVAVSRGTTSGWIALTSSHTLLASTNDGSASTESSHLLHAAIAVSRAPQAARLPKREATNATAKAVSEINNYLLNENARSLLGLGNRELSSAQRKALAAVADCLSQLSPPRRAQLASAAASAECMIHAAKPLGAERELERWIAARESNEAERFLSSWKHIPSLARLLTKSTEAPLPSPERTLTVSDRLLALIVIIK